MTYDIEMNSIDDIDVWKVKRPHRRQYQDLKKNTHFEFSYYGIP